MSERVERAMWRDPVLGDVWAVEILMGRVVGYAGPISAHSRPLDIDTLRFERDPAFLRGIAERFERPRDP